MRAHVLPCPGQSILDFGCGTGRLSTELATEVGSEGRVVGVDPDKERISVARRTSSNIHTHLTFHEGFSDDAVTFGPFDTVFSNYVFHWLQPETVQSTLRDLHDCLKPGGRLVACFPSQPGELDVQYVSLATKSDDKSIFGPCLRPLAFWRQECLDARFQVIAAYDPDVCYTFPNVKSYFHFVKAYTVGKIDPADIAENDMKEFLQKHNIHSMDDRVAWTESNVIRILAKKCPISVPERTSP
jgi:SAM-dependent methyltransferase